jgi:eukaryotic-like serine/threonine-protein kinase
MVARVRKAAGEDDLRGQFAGEYKMLRRVGAGGFGAVYEAEHPILKRKAAVKVLHASRTLDESAVRRFISEAQTATQLRHRHIVDIFSFGKLPSGQHFYVMDLLDGVALDRYLAERRELAPEIALPILRSVAEALDALHARGVVHRDVKPPNIFLAWESSGEVIPKLLDFGLVKLLSDAQVHTASGVPMGTPYYMSPEQCRGEKIDARADVYSLGVICHELLSGRPPFTADTPAAVLVAHLVQPPPRLSEVTTLPPSLDEPILHMLAKDAAARTPSAGAAVAELERAARGAGFQIPAGFLHLPRPSTPPSERDSWVSEEAGGQSGRRLTRVGAARSGWLFPLGGALVLGGLVSAALLFKREPSAAPAAAVSAAAQAPSALATPSGEPAPATSASAPAPAAARVALTLLGAPPGASVFLGDEELGKAPGPLWLPAGKEPLALRVTASGYEAKTIKVVPEAAAELKVTLTKAARGASKRSAPGDLENPF